MFRAWEMRGDTGPMIMVKTAPEKSGSKYVIRKK